MAIVIHEVKVGDEQFKGTSAANIDATRETIIMVCIDKNIMQEIKYHIIIYLNS